MHLSYVRVLADHFAECFRFYRDIMGFAVLIGDEANVYAEFKVSQETRLAVCARHVVSEIPGVSPGPAPAADRFMLVVEVDDVDRAVADLKRRGASAVTEPVDRAAWGVRTAHFRDPDGNLIEINRPLPS